MADNTEETLDIPETEPEPEPRKDFPETWLWDIAVTEYVQQNLFSSLRLSMLI